ncbi:MAG: hypothetical protein OCD02_03185 [Spirochaetaceae bacterium]
MGLFGWIKEKVSAATKKVKSVVSNCWGSFSGKTDHDEAKRRYEALKAEFELKKNRFENDIDIETQKIKTSLKSINNNKKLIHNQYFPLFTDKMKNFHNIGIKETEICEIFDYEIKTKESLKSKSDLFLIDFDNHKFKTNAQAVFTLGFLTRKRAKETLLRVEEEELKAKEIYAKMDSEVNKIKLTVKSIEQVEKYFNDLISIFSNLIDDCDFATNYLLSHHIMLGFPMKNKKLDASFLPTQILEQLRATFSVAIILGELSRLRYLSNSNVEIEKKDLAIVTEKYKEIEVLLAA